MEVNEFIHQNNVYEVPFLTLEHTEFVLWFFTGSKCNLTCNHCYVDSSPTADQHPLLTYSTFKRYLDETVTKNHSKLEIYFTGGEPFVNQEIIEMLDESLKHGDTTVLTNATRISKEISFKLKEIQDKHDYKLTFRVSLDGPNAEMNDEVRGRGSFDRAQQGLKNLIDMGFTPIITAMKSWTNQKDSEIENQFNNLFSEYGVPKERHYLKILPILRIGRETDRTRPYGESELFTEECFIDYDFNNLQCSKCRMVSENGVWVCPILINEEEGRMGNTITETERPYKMKSMACWTCRMEGMSCTN